jgi:hypothetical protein
MGSDPFRLIAEIAASIIVALGGGGAIVFGLSSWLGKVWADRLMQKEKAKHDQDLEDFKAKAIRKLEEEKAHYERELENFKSHLERENKRAHHTFEERIAFYKEAMTPVIDLITESQRTAGKLEQTTWFEFEKKRLATSIQFAMFASVDTSQAYDTLIDYIFDCSENKKQFSWPELREYAYKVVNEIRKDVGATGEAIYQGTR